MDNENIYVSVPPNDEDFDWGVGAEVENDEPETEPAEEKKGE